MQITQIILLIIISIILLLNICIFGTDFVLFLKNRYCRFHIGRWDTDEWKKAVYRKCLKWAKKSPTVKISDNSRYILLDAISGKYRSNTIQSWQNASIILGILEHEPDKARKIALEHLTNDGNWKKQPTKVDFAMLAYAVMKSCDDYDFIKPAMDYMVSIIESNKDSDNIISYEGGHISPNFYVDTLGLVCPFLALYAKVYNVPQYEELAFKQLEFYHSNGLYKDTQLPNHAINKSGLLPLGVYGWGRGTAWYVIGLLDTYYELQNETYKKSLIEWIEIGAESYLNYQNKDGGFGSIFQKTDSYDSSATSVMAYFYYNCYKLFDDEKYLNASKACLSKLKGVTRITGSIDWCQGDTKGIGVFSMTFDIMPFAQGFTVRSLNASEE